MGPKHDLAPISHFSSPKQVFEELAGRWNRASTEQEEVKAPARREEHADNFFSAEIDSDTESEEEAMEIDGESEGESDENDENDEESESDESE